MVSKMPVRDDAISAVVMAEGTLLPLPVKALIELRYRADGGTSWYPNVEDGKISSVWKEIEAKLSPDIAELIAAEEIRGHVNNHYHLSEAKQGALDIARPLLGSKQTTCSRACARLTATSSYLLLPYILP